MPAKVNDKNRRPFSDEEISIGKYMFDEGSFTDQEVYRTLLMGREFNENFGRISNLKKNTSVKPATSKEYKTFIWKRANTDMNTWLNPIDHFHIVRAREAAMKAVAAYNTPSFYFRNEQFAIFLIVAWNQLFIQHAKRFVWEYLRSDDNSRVKSFGALIEENKAGLAEGTVKNLGTILKVRNDAEHRGLESLDSRYHGIYQASLYEFDEFLVSLTNDKCSLKGNLGYALQLNKFNLESGLIFHDSKLDKFVEEEWNDHHFSVTVSPQPIVGGKTSIDLPAVAAEPMFEYLEKHVVPKIRESYPEFTSHLHQNAWRHYNLRDPSNINAKKYTFQNVYGSWQYSEEWIEFLLDQITKKGGIEFLKDKKS